MPESLIFREALKEPETAEEMEHSILALESDDATGATKVKEESDEPMERPSALENWEMEHGKYGLELFGIQEIAKEFPYNMQFGALDSYIKGEMKEKGLEASPKKYMEILAELEAETGTRDMETLSKMKKLYDYIQVVHKYRKIKEKKDSFRASF